MEALITPTIQNMVFTASLGVPLNIKHIARMQHSRVDLNPCKFASSIFRSMWPRTTILLFSTGKVVVTGCKTRWCAFTSVRDIIAMLNGIGYAIQNMQITLQNVVGSTHAGMKIDTDYLAQELQEEGSHEAELFPGFVYRPYDANVTLLCFKSGKMVLTGCSDENDIANAQKYVERIKEITRKRKDAVGEVHKYSKRVRLE